MSSTYLDKLAQLHLQSPTASWGTLRKCPQFSHSEVFGDPRVVVAREVLSDTLTSLGRKVRWHGPRKTPEQVRHLVKLSDLAPQEKMALNNTCRRAVLRGTWAYHRVK